MPSANVVEKKLASEVRSRGKPLCIKAGPRRGQKDPRGEELENLPLDRAG